MLWLQQTCFECRGGENLKELLIGQILWVNAAHLPIVAAIYAAIVMVWNATHHHAVIDPQVIIAALGAAAFLYARFKVTPVADPKDGNGQPLVAATPARPEKTAVAAW